MNGYMAFFRGKQHEVWANSSLEAQEMAAAFFKARKSYQVSVVLCEKDGEQIVHTAVN